MVIASQRQIQILETGDIAITRGDVVLTSGPLGSCIAVVLAVPGVRVAGMAHVMLPGRCAYPERFVRSKYADDAIELLVEQMPPPAWLCRR